MTYLEGFVTVKWYMRQQDSVYDFPEGIYDTSEGVYWTLKGCLSLTYWGLLHLRRVIWSGRKVFITHKKSYMGQQFMTLQRGYMGQ